MTKKNFIQNEDAFFFHWKLPCKYGISLHSTSPNTKSRSCVPINVNGIQNTPNKISETAKFNKNTFVIVRIRRFCTSVIMTNELPTSVSNKIVAYNGIWTRALENQSIHDISGGTFDTFAVTVDVAAVAATTAVVVAVVPIAATARLVNGRIVESNKLLVVDVCTSIWLTSSVDDWLASVSLIGVIAVVVVYWCPNRMSDSMVDSDVFEAMTLPLMQIAQGICLLAVYVYFGANGGGRGGSGDEEGFQGECGRSQPC